MGIMTRGITFQFTGQLAGAAGRSEVVLDGLSEGSSLIEALSRLAEGAADPEMFRALVFRPDGRVRSTLLVVFDGVQAPGDKDAMLLGADVRNVMLMTPIAGG